MESCLPRSQSRGPVSSELVGQGLDESLGESTDCLSSTATSDRQWTAN